MLRPSFIAALSLSLTLSASAQMHKVAAPEKVTRAVGVYEFTGDDPFHPTAARLVPVTLFISNHLEDAGDYLPQPVPFALQAGIVYSLDQAGKSLGTFDLHYARNILPPGSTTDVAAIGAWYGYGDSAPPAPPRPSTLVASAHPVSIDGSDDDDRPHFTGRQPGQPDTAPAKPSSADPNRPTMSRRDGAPDPDSPAASTPSTGTGTIPDDDPDRPTLRHRDPAQPKPKGKQSDSGVIGPETSLNDDPDRPKLQRGKPAGLLSAPQLTTTPPDLHQLVAVSDAADRDPHIFTRSWDSPAERADTLHALEAIAQARTAAYIATWHFTSVQPSAPALQPPPPTPADRPQSHIRIGARSVSNTLPPPPLALEQLTPLTLAYGGLPTFVFTAQSPLNSGGPVYITLIAQRLPSGELQLAFSSLTDADHLDRTPWFRFIDAVDPTWSHRASLLFELRAQTTRQFALYSLTTAHAEQQFITTPIP